MIRLPKAPEYLANDARHLGVTLVAAGLAALFLGGRKVAIGGVALGILGAHVWRMGVRAQLEREGITIDAEARAPLPTARSAEPASL